MGGRGRARHFRVHPRETGPFAIRKQKRSRSSCSAVTFCDKMHGSFAAAAAAAAAPDALKVGGVVAVSVFGAKPRRTDGWT